jgi:hypothetical protein
VADKTSNRLVPAGVPGGSQPLGQTDPRKPVSTESPADPLKNGQQEPSGPSSDIFGPNVPDGWSVDILPGGGRVAGTPSGMALERRVRAMSRRGGLSPADLSDRGE